jgi:hypothetical protein
VGATHGVVSAVALNPQTAVLLARTGETPSFPVLVYGVDDPVDAGVVPDAHVVGVDEDDLEVFVGGVLVDPVGVQDTQVHGVPAGALLGHAAQVARELEVVDTLVHGLSVHDTLVERPLAATSAHGAAQDHIALLGLVSELVRLVSAGGASHLDHLLALAVLPRSVYIDNKMNRGGI